MNTAAFHRKFRESS